MQNQKQVQRRTHFSKQVRYLKETDAREVRALQEIARRPGRSDGNEAKMRFIRSSA